LETELLQEFLPELLLTQFEVVKFFKSGNIETKKMEFEIHLDERNKLPPGYSKDDYESKGFLPATRIQDFPIRGKAVYLIIRKRRWRHKQTGKEITNDYSFIAEGSRLTKEISDFLKGTGRDPRRYDK
jgi:transposase